MTTETIEPIADPAAMKAFINEWSETGGAETANFQGFIKELTTLLGIEHQPKSYDQVHRNDYSFEREVKFKEDNRTNGFIDLYRRDSFVMEAKQSKKRKKTDQATLEMFGEDARQKSGTAVRGTKSWDKTMRAARNQAIGYARALPVDHGYPPFVIVVDVGNVIELYADFSGQGKNYAQFPDRRSYRIGMDELLDPAVQHRLRAVWLDPQSLNPALISARVTRDIAERLAKIAKTLEGKHDAETVAHFLMRCLFTMFAEDVGLIPKKSFEDLLEQLKANPQGFVPTLEALWKTMDAGGYSVAIQNSVRHFNGGLFADCRALPLDADAIHELHVAAKRDWSDVEPAIFGTLLEQALDPRERGKLGAHYTPRAYVERLVIPTIIEPLRQDWENVLTRATELHEAGEDDAALKAVKAFHHQLCTTRVLDPACGTGNFLYVSLDLMKDIENDVVVALEDLGLAEPKFAFEGETITPRQFYGLDINARAVAIADLVLWLGYIKRQIADAGLDSVRDPVLERLNNIRHQDAILAYDGKDLARNDDGEIISRWDGFTTKKNHLGNDVPDPDARVESYTYDNPKRAPWPEAEFIVGNPPFIGGKDMRAQLGDGYAEAAWAARPKVPGGADFVMHFWEEAAARLSRKPSKAKPNPLRRFGFITTNSITQTFSRRVVEAALSAKSPISLVFAVPDHPWMKASDKAAVRIAMTVAERGEMEGVLGTVVKEEGLETDAPEVALIEETGSIRPFLSLGANLSTISELLGNSELSSMGVKLHGSGFQLKEGKRTDLDNFDPVKSFKGGFDLTQGNRNIRVIDVNKLSLAKLETDFPSIYQYLKDEVYPQRKGTYDKSPTADAKDYLARWWTWGKRRVDLFKGISDLNDFIVTARTAKHRNFQLLDTSVIPESEVICFKLSERHILTSLASRTHVIWMLKLGGTLEDRPRYNHSVVFSPFPFPACITDDSNPAFRDRLAVLGERLDAHRKSVMEQHDHLTITRMYNVLERVRELEAGIGEPLSPSEKDVYDAGMIGILKEIHDEIDRAVLEAYGWSDLAPDLVGKVGGTLPSPYKSPEQEAAEEELLSRLVALNVERREEERRGQVRWLRPDYQIPKLGHKVTAETKDMDVAQPVVADKPAWPKDGLEQIKIVRELLSRADAPVETEAVTRSFKQKFTAKRHERVSDVLETLVATGVARKADAGTYFLPG